MNMEVENSAMNAQGLIELFGENQVEVRVEQGELVIKAARGFMTPNVIASLKLHKRELLAWAEARPAGTQQAPAVAVQSKITPDMLPLVRLTQTQIDRIVQATPGGVANVQDIYPLAPLQEGILFHHLLQQEGDAYLNRLLMSFDHQELLDRFLRAVNQVIARHDVLRTAMHWDGLEDPVQVVLRQAQLEVQKLSFDGGDVQAQLQAHVDPRHFRMDVRRAPLIQGFAAFDQDGQRWLLQLLYHHLVMDHISLELLVHEVVMFMQEREAELAEPVPFRNFVAQARLGNNKTEHENFFRRMLGDVDSSTAPFDLLNIQGNGANTVQSRHVLDTALADRLRRVATAHGVSPASVFHLAWAQVLGACTGRDDVVFGTVLFGRMQGGAGADRAMGMFINTLPLRVKLGVHSALHSVRETSQLLVELLHHEQAPLTLAQRCSAMTGSAPLFSALLNYRYSRPVQASEGEVIDGILHIESRDQTNYPFVLHVDDLGEGFRVTTEIVHSLSAERIGGFVLQVLEGLVAALESAADTPMQAIPALSRAEREQVLYRLNATRREDGPEATVHALFEQQAARTPEAVALEFEGQQLAYAELNARANQLAHYLRELGVQPDDRVALCFERGIDLIVAIVATLKAGGAYVPLDPVLPDERLAHMLHDSAPAALLTQQHLRDRFAGQAHLVVTDGDAPWRQHPADDLPAGGLSPANLAYVLYTSGSTGLPKGVCMPHRALVNLLRWQRDDLPLPARTLQFAALGFDVAFQEIFSTLCSGGTLVMLSESLRLDLPALADWMRAQDLQRLYLPYIALNSLSELWSQQDQPLPALQDLITAGEQLRITPAIRRLFAQCPQARLHNHYGPTESHVVAAHVLTGPSESWEDLPPIGAPIANSRLYLLDANREPVPLGVTGEIYIAGVQVARAYLGRPDLSEERFLADPFVDGERMYKSGDLGRWRADGVIDYLGRNDFQVKIRGFRIELGEIETQLARLDGVREAVVVAREDQPGDKRLVAYLLAGEATPEPAQLRAALADKLPEYMLPSAFVTLDAWPLTPNGKLDRKALPVPDGYAFVQRAYEATIGDIETTLAQIWSELLGIEQVGRHDNFFELGGHSLLAVRLVSRLRECLGIELPLSVLFTHPRLADLALDVAEAGQDTLSTIARADRSAPLPLSLAQQRLWFISRVDARASKAYHVPDAVRLRGTLDKAALQGALDRIVARHEVLRTRFVGIGGQVRQVIDEPRGFALTHQDLDGASALELDRISKEEASQSFDLALGPLIRGRLLRLGDDDHVLLVTTHHIISDGWSAGVLAQEFSTLYQALRNGQPDPMPPLPIQYADYGVWQRQWLQGPLLQQQLQQWVQQLQGAPALLSLPTDRPRPPMQDYRGANVEINLDAELTQGLKALSQRHGTTMYMTLVAAWAAVLSRLSGQEQVVIGSSHAGRSRVEVEPLIGFFINTQALKIDLSGRPSVQSLLVQAKQMAVQAQSLQDVPFERLVEALNPPRSLSHHPVFQVMLSWHNTPKVQLELPGLTAETVGGAPEFAQFDLSLELREIDDRIGGQLNYATALFDEATIQRQWTYLHAMLRQMVTDDAQLVDQIDLLSPAERSLVLDSFNQSAIPPAQAGLIHALFEQQAAAQPKTTAIVFEGQQLSYRELNERANQLAHHLRELGVGPDARVAICAERSLDMVIALFATLKAGGAYVPLDPVYPDERLAHMLQDSAPVAVLTQAALRARLDLPGGSACLVLDAASWEQSAWGNGPRHNPDASQIGLSGEHLAYMIYTSGSTGTPKGVMVEHRNVLTFLHGLEACIHGVQPDCRRVAWNSSFGFDMAVKAWGQLARGRTVYLIPEITRLSGEALLGFIEEHRIEALECTPSHLRMLQNAGFLKGRARTLRKLLLGGEAIDTVTWNELAAVEDTLFFNMYGPTECSVDASCGLIDGRTPNIGQVMPGARIYLLDEARQPVPIGVAGELHIGGAGVARGYLNREELTAERFVDDPFAAGAHARMYKTGDLGRWRADGSIEYLGRNDFQVKLRGFRIELGEIEAQLSRLDGVRGAAVIAREDQPGDKRLVAYIVAAPHAAAPDPAQLRAQLSSTLPDYMLPSAIVTLEALPLTPNGKLDRKALPAPEGQGLAQQSYEAPEGEIEQMIAALWSELLGVERVGRHDNFYDLGGYSLMVFEVIEGLKQKGFQVTLQDILLAQKLSELAQLLTAHHGGAQTSDQWVTIRRGGQRQPLIFIHEPSGEVLSYERLARHIDDEVGLYGIRADRSTVAAGSSYEQIAQRYAQIIREALPGGPYRLAGWSAGGVLAYEVARQLMAQDQTVEFVGLIDSWHRGTDHGITREIDLNDKKMLLVSYIEYQGYKLGDTEVAKLMAAADLPAALDCAKQHGWLSQGLAVDEFDARVELAFNLRVAAHHYAAQPLAVPVHLFTAQPDQPSDPANGWRQVAGARLQVHPIGGNHWSLMMDPVRAGHLGSAIASVLASIDGTAARAEAAHHPAAVVISSGDGHGTKVFCIPGAGANATSFLDLSASLAHGATYIGLEAEGLLGLASTVQAAARHYVEAIRTVQPAGPYYLAGHSFGGWIALEVARQLIQAAQVVAPVVVIDSEAPRAQGHRARSEAMAEYIYLVELAGDTSLGISDGDLARRDEAGQIRLVFERMKKAGLLPVKARITALQTVIETFLRQCTIGYLHEQPFGGSLLLLLATPEQGGNAVDLSAWRRAEPGLRVVKIDGSDHLSILKAPYAGLAAKEILKQWYLG
ncbi:amino acid adenylation domain-containing protein [Duganella sacchari]|uniref:Amino acid adenylation domain-containing protein n=2 Tax=Duganella sacchari TaxID=551987 RepID=A0A1M7KV41_9BURK|nr:non-ribosomal peptide synthetase [Duganella sacchari]SHM69443.1 amino acid adenylation domain-containing protein [Duganella sacchari]